MTKSTITRERLQEIAEDGFLKHGESKELARMALAAMGDEPHTDDELSNLLWYSQEATCHSDPNYYCEFQRLATPGFIAWIIRELQERRKADMNSEPYGFTDGDRRGMIYKPEHADRLNEPMPVYRHAQPAPERDQVRSEHAEWSQDTFGDVGPVGPLKHLSKEALEAAAEPDDLSEWADMQFLLWDAQRRAGITDEHITQAMIEKLAVNKQREWPEPKDGEPRLHIKEQPAPVVQKVMSRLAYLLDEDQFHNIESMVLAAGIHPVGTSQVIPEVMSMEDLQYKPLTKSWREGWNACRAAMLAAAPQEVQGE